jgi:indole-3-glycerol phosphate synthase
MPVECRKSQPIRARLRATVVAESGYNDPAQVEELERIGVDAVLIGESLMRSGDPEDAVSSLVSDEETTREHLVSDER